MLSYIVRRLLLFVPTLLAVWAILFLTIRQVGDPAIVAAGKGASAEQIASVRRQMGLDRPVFLNTEALAHGLVAIVKPAGAAERLNAKVDNPESVFHGDDLHWFHPRRPVRSLLARGFDTQFVTSLADKLRLDFGRSVAYNQPVGRMIREGLGPSLSVTVPMFLLGLVVSVYLAMFCALYRARLVDHTITFGCIVLMSLSLPAVILLLQHALSGVAWFPVSGYAYGWRAAGYVALPVLIGTMLGLGQNTRFYRSVLIEEVRKDYVRTAHAKGLERGVVLFKHVLKNAMIPIVTRVVIAIPFLYAGAFLLETFFGIPGLGRMAYEALQDTDYVVIEAITFIGAMLFMVANLVCDLLYVFLDPRVRLQ